MTPRESWIPGLPAGDLFGIHNLPYGLVSGPPLTRATLVVRIGDHVLDLAAAAVGSEHAPLLEASSLNPLLAAGRPVWRAARTAVVSWLSDETFRARIEPLLLPLAGLRCHLPFEVADYVDFYSSEHHATTVGRLFRPGSPALPVNWKHLPIGYHGRAGTVVVSGTPIARPSGQRLVDGAPAFGPSLRLDIEAEVGFVVGGPTALGEQVSLSQAAEHIFGVCLVNDWSARDIQAWEYVPLGPFLGKSFATSVSPWIVPLDALATARVAPPARDHPLLPYLDDTKHDGSAPDGGGLDIALTVSVNESVVSRPPFASMYWTPFQQLAHLTANGASLRAGDFFASGTVSGPKRGQEGSLLELTLNGAEPVELDDGSVRAFLEDGDEVVITGQVAAAPGRPALGLGEVRGRVVAGPA